MARKRIKMKKIRDILKHSYETKLSIRQIAGITGISKTVVSDYLSTFKKSGMEYKEIEKMSDTDLISLFKGEKEENNIRYKEMLPQMPYFTKELKKTGVTRYLLWKEYAKDNDDAFSYSQFCHHLQCWQGVQNLSMKQHHIPGEKLFVDYAGDKLTYFNGRRGEERKAEVFVAVLGASGLTFAEAAESQKKESFVRSVEHAFHFFGGVTKAVVPDNLKSAVIKADKYEPEINPLFDDFADYYRTVIYPARAYRPKDKALVENAVRLMYQRIFAPLRNREFYSLEELNEAVKEKLSEHNNRKMQVLGVSRQELFEEIEKSKLKTLPTAPYPMKSFETHKVAPDYHVLLSEDKHYYSVPWQLKGEKVRIIYDEKTVAIYFENKRVTGYRRNSKRGGYTTKEEHMPPHHLFYASWTSEKFEKWALSIGEETHKVVIHLLESRRYPEQAFKSCIGILSLSAKSTNHDLNMACRKAWNLDQMSYRKIKEYLEDILVQKDLNSDDKQVFMFQDHENLRNAADYS